MSEKGWKFPSSGGGMEGGFNDSGIETYAGNPFESLAREIIQNSLDARASGDLVNPSPVRVSFELAEVPQGDFPGHGEILDAMQKCRKASKGEKKAEKFFARAEQILKGAVINCLKVLDYGTTGLCDGKGDDLKTGQWHRLVKATGRSAKDSNTAGGSYGIGKNAPFAVSELRTVFYSTRCKDSGGRVCEMAQGKAILVSHDLEEGGDSQPVGFYGWKEKDGEKLARLTGDDIPQLLRRSGDEEGTTLLIPGLSETADWQNKIIAAVISNYFYAIHNGELEVLIDGAPDAYSVIDATTLPYLLADKQIQESGERVEEALYYHRAIQEGKLIEAQLTATLGYCALWLLVKEECPKSVAILRRGMKITDRSTGLIHWGDSFSDFVAVCICKSEKGNALLRRMENPAHDAFEPARLLEDKAFGEKALRELAKWIRDQIKEFAQEKIEEVTPVSRMAKFFSAPEDTLPGENAEKDFDGGSSVRIQPTKISTTTEDDTDDEGDGSGGDEGDIPGDGSGDGGEGGGTGGSTGKKRPEVPMEIEAVRVLSMSDEAHKRVIFTPRQTGAAALSLKVAGDSFTEDIGGIAEVLDENHGKIEDGKVLLRVVAGKRLSLKVRLANPFSGSLSVTLGDRTKKSDEVDS